ncbi:hypothetical protein [Rubritalea tangerina]|uniref:Uncharacterized protein n=1 Tax=Rubritalea tangerina TaxID=430798 RepID=A0ABW4Z9Q3_9BACT
MKPRIPIIFSAIGLALVSCERSESVAPESKKEEKAAVDQPPAPVKSEEEVVPEEQQEEVVEPDKAVRKHPVAPIPTSAGGEKKEPYALEDVQAIKTRAGGDVPPLGTMIYTYSNLPKEACGEYWVQDNEGYVEKLAVCTGDHTH